MSRLAWCVLVNPHLISISFSNLSKHFKATAAREWLPCLGTSVSASLPEEGEGAQTPLLSTLQGHTFVHPDPPVAGVEAGSEPDLSSDPGAVKVVLGDV